MLQKMRENFAGAFAVGLLAMIALSFVFFGLDYSFIGGSYAAKVDGEEIDVLEFERDYRDALVRNPQIASLPADVRAQVRRSILDQLVAQQLIENFLDENDFRVSDEQLTSYIREQPVFQVDGRFNRETYQAWLAEQNLQPAQFEALQRSSLRQQQLQQAIAATAVVTPAEYRRYLNLAAEQRVVRIASIDPESIADEIDVTDDMVAAYYENHPDEFRLPESADVEYIEISRAAVAEDIAVSEDEIKDYYEDNRDRWLQDEQRRARHILILAGDDADAARAKAAEALARVRAGESFADVAAELSADTSTAEQGGDLGALTRSQLPEALADVVFEMAEGELAGPVESEFGYHVVQLDDILERGPLPLEQVRAEILGELRSSEAEARFRDLERALSDALFDSSSLAEVSEATGLEVQSASGITRAGGEPFGANQAAIDAIFADDVLTGGRLSDIVELDADRSAIFSVTSHREAARQPLDDVREQVVAALEEEQAEILMQARAEQMQEALDDGTEFAAAAEAAGLAAGEPQTLTRTSDAVDASLRFEVFAAGKPAEDEPVYGRVRLQDGGYAVYQLAAVLPGRPESIPLAERDRGKVMLAQQSGMGDLQAFVRSLYEDADIEINEELLAAEDTFQ